MDLWTQRNPRRKRSSLNDSLLPSNGAGVSKNGRGKAGTGSAVSSALLLSAAPCTGTAANCGPGGPVGPVDAVLSSLMLSAVVAAAARFVPGIIEDDTIFQEYEHNVEIISEFATNR